jgi:hypothetical protein
LLNGVGNRHLFVVGFVGLRAICHTTTVPDLTSAETPVFG